jgi:Cdc6-like AAA superfamily ATPase
MYHVIDVDISGVPGIGKTALVRKVVDAVLRLPKMRTATSSYYINAMQLKRPEDIYCCMLSRIFDVREKNVSKAMSRLSSAKLI